MEWYENGKPKSKIIYNNDTPDGVAYKWDEKGNKFQCTYNNGKIIDDWATTVGEGNAQSSLKETLKQEQQTKTQSEKETTNPANLLPLHENTMR